MNLIFACTFNGGLGYKNRLPWIIPSELKKFQDITTHTLDSSKQNAVIMGRTTYESIGKPLNNRLNIVLTRNENMKDDQYDQHDKTLIFKQNLNEAISYCKQDSNIEYTYIIGGGEIYNQVLQNYKISKIFMSVIFDHIYETDVSINMQHIFSNFDIEKDERYSSESKQRLFASFIGTPKSK